MSEIVKSDGVVQLAERGQWTRERVDLIKRTICPKGIRDDAFALFIEQCKRSGMDPLLKEAFCVPRRQKVGDNWVEMHVFQPAESGMLARAERFPDFKGIQASAVYAEDDIIVDQGEGVVRHSFNPARRKGQLAGAWARVVREHKLPVVVWLDFQGYVQQTPLWSKIPTTMIEKCARVAALRKAYPEAFGGLYIAEEMPGEEEDNGSKARKRTDTERKALPPPPEDPLPPEKHAEIEAQFRAASEQVTGNPVPPSEEETHVLTGVHKGKRIVDLDDVSLAQALEDVKAVATDPANAKKKSQPKAARSYAALQAEVDFRKRPPEPGSNG